MITGIWTANRTEARRAGSQISPAREGWDIDSATSSERRRRGTPNVGGAAPPALHNLGDPSPSPSPDFLGLPGKLYPNIRVYGFR